MFAIRGTIITPPEIIKDGIVVVDGGKIKSVGTGFDQTPIVPGTPCSQTIISRSKVSPPTKDISVIDCREKFICPGFIDVHVQGAGGADILDGTYEAINTIAKTLAENGTTAFLATTVVNVEKIPSPRVSGERVRVRGKSKEFPPHLYLLPPKGREDIFFQSHLKAVAEAMKHGTDGAEVLGIHLEGPFVNPAKRGMIKRENIVYSAGTPCHDKIVVRLQGVPERFDEILGACGGALKMMTIAPEMPGAIDIIKRLKKNKIVTSIGHTDATYDEAIKGFDAGITHATHMFNAMSGLHHRKPNAAGAILADERISVQLIADGRHLHPAVVNLVVKQKGPDKIALITDSMSAAGLPDGRYVYNGLRYQSKDGLAVYAGTDTLIGTTLTLNKVIKRIVDMGAADLEDAVRMASLTPAEVLGIDKKKGSLEVGKDADIVVMDKKCEVEMVFVKGRKIDATGGSL